MRLSIYPTALALALLAVCTASAQQPINEKQELAVTVATLSGTTPTATFGSISVGSGVAFEADYARKISDLRWASIYWEVDGVVSPLRDLSGFPVTATNRIRSVYLTPAVRVQFMPKERFSPWISAGEGYAFYDSSGTSIAGGTTGGGVKALSGTSNKIAADFGVGVDFVTSKHYVLRGDVRGFYTGSPNYGTPVTGGQFNFLIGGGIVWRFGK